MNSATNVSETGNAIGHNVAFCKSTVVYARHGSVTGAWAMGWLAGAGCSGYRMPRYLSDEARAAYADGKAEGLAAKLAASR